MLSLAAAVLIALPVHPLSAAGIDPAAEPTATERTVAAGMRRSAFLACPTGTGLSATLLLPPDAALTQPGGALEPGDEIALLAPDGSCAGVGTWNESGTAIVVWADDPFTPDPEGLAEGARFRFAVWDASAGQVRAPSEVGVTFVDGYDAEAGFQVDALYIVAEQDQATAPDPEPAAMAVVALQPSYPNPARGRTTLSFSLAEAGPTTVEVFDALGRLVARPVEGERAAGAHTVSFDASGLSSGVYVVRLRAGEAILQQRMTVSR